MPLTDTNIRNAKGNGKEQKLSDGEGLYLFISKQDSKLWRMAYRYEGKQKTLSFGKYPAVTLQEARRRRGLAKEQLATGLDPVKKRRKLKHLLKLSKKKPQILLKILLVSGMPLIRRL